MSESRPSDPSQVVRAYHQRTAHRFEAYARGPEALDWDAQPAPFRHFDGAPVTPLPRLGAPGAAPALAEALGREFGRIGAAPTLAVAPDLAGLGALLQLSLGITAWKRLGPDRWALRANPSSGNLHPLEAYVVVESWPGLEDGVHHYRPEDHALEQRAAFAPGRGGEPRLFIGLSSVMWREAWKYGERAFRYCQLDVGHGLGALAYGAAVLGWGLAEVPTVGQASLARLLGLDRIEDFPWRRKAHTEREEPERLLELRLPGMAPGQVGALLERAAAARWMGVASAIDPFPMFQWGVIEEVAAATRRPDGPRAEPLPLGPRTPAGPGVGRPAAEVILQRRSAQRFDPACVMPRADFDALLAAIRPAGCAPWNVLARPPALNLILYVHRVEGLAPGIYLLERVAQPFAGLRDACARKHPVAAVDPGLGLSCVQTADPVQLRRVSRSLHCHQDIAATACFAVGMVAELDPILERDPAAYRDLHGEAGVLGQVLYLEAEARGYQGTGIGCYFDEPVREAMGLEEAGFRTLYHFTVGRGVADPRIETDTGYV